MYKSFSHIYIEKEIKDHPRTLDILSKFRGSQIIEISHYKDVFNRRGQNFRDQKQSPKLILASRKDNFLYPGSHFSPSFDFPHFYYNTLALNCLYDCTYCYLQGMFSSANIVLFVNWEEYFAATDQFLQANGSLYLAISYDTDLLATESFFPATQAWIDFAQTRPNLTLEIRTKSNNFEAIKQKKAIENAILAWTISPQNITKDIEKKTPSLEARISAIQEAIEAGWKVRLCIDPILREPAWKKDYETLVQKISDSIDLEKLHDISIGTFRMNTDFLSKIQSIRSDAALLYYPFIRSDGIVSYSTEENEEMISFIKQCFGRNISPDKIKVSY
jgi:spore photoproduct lyase